VFIIFCHDYDETHRVEFSSSRNPRVSHRVDEVNSRIELSSLCLLLFIKHPKGPVKSLPFDHLSKIPISCVRVIEGTLGLHKNHSCIS
jgi:hypothetical protein